MSDCNTGTAGTSSVAERIRTIETVVDELESNGVKVLGVSVGYDDLPDYILFSDTFGIFRRWADEKSLDVRIVGNISNAVPELNWIIRTHYCGVEIRSFMTDKEKEAYENGED